MVRGGEPRGARGVHGGGGPVQCRDASIALLARGRGLRGAIPCLAASTGGDLASARQGSLDSGGNGGLPGLQSPDGGPGDTAPGAWWDGAADAGLARALLAEGGDPALLAVPGGSGLPADLDGDGACEDVNGNGRGDFADLVLLFNQLAWIIQNEPAGGTSLDYNDNARLDFADVTWLFEHTGETARPSVTGLSPTSAALGRTITADVLGADFAPGAQVKLERTWTSLNWSSGADTIDATNETTIGPGLIRCTLVIPSSDRYVGNFPVYVRNPGTDDWVTSWLADPITLKDTGPR